MERRPLIMINTDNAPTFCRSRCNNTHCSKHISKAYQCTGPCKMTLLKGSSDCEGFSSTRKKGSANGANA